jgi:general secretion pathway protein E
MRARDHDDAVTASADPPPLVELYARDTSTATIVRAEPRKSLRVDLVSGAFIERIPRDFARAHLVVSQGRSGDAERLAVAEGADPLVVFNVGVRLRSRIEAFTAPAEAIASTIDAAYGVASGGDDGAAAEGAGAGEVERLLAEADRDLLSTSGKGPVVRLVDALLFEAIAKGASDVHVQPLEEVALVRYRRDGVLHTVREISLRIAPAVISRIKVMGRMDIAERLVPQDGRATVTIGDTSRDSGAGPSGAGGGGASGGRSIDLRISTLPTPYGERAVLRLLDRSQQICNFERLGMPPEVADRFLARAQLTNGIILVTGPTGSGKSTTLYSTLRRIGSPDRNVMTIEDPIEYNLSALGLAITQAQVNTRKGITFASGLRHVLRQDPDVIMVGEIRDAETARIAIQSSLTGHLVFSTLHTNDAVSAVTRLVDLGVEAYLVGASLSAVLAQRLVRVVHAECAGAGCEDCLGTGFQGRTGLFELLVVDDPTRELIIRGAPLSELRTAAAASGLRTLRDEGDRLAREGTTTPEEVARVVAGI